MRVPPHDLRAEESLLGAMLLSRDAIGDVVDTIDAEDFYKPAHGNIYEAIIDLYSHGEPVDVVTVTDQLRRGGRLESSGGPAALITIQSETPATSSAGRYAAIIGDWARVRHMIGAAGEIAEMGYDLPEDIPAAIDRAEQLIYDIADRTSTKHAIHLHDGLNEWLDRLERLYENGEPPGVVPTGFIDLDERLIGGLRPGNLVIVAGRPGMGKSAFLGNIAIHAAHHANIPTLFVSAEMTVEELEDRFIASESRIDITRLKSGKLLESDWPKMGHTIGRIGEAPLWLHEASASTILSIRAEARRVSAKTGLGMIIVDYIQLLKGTQTKENRQVEVAELTRSLKEMALDLHIPVVAAAQLNRGLEIRADKRPGLADLRESGELEQAADIVIFLYRDDYYNKESSEKGECEVIVAKHRNGAPGTERLAWLDHYGRFANMVKM